MVGSRERMIVNKKNLRRGSTMRGQRGIGTTLSPPKESLGFPSRPTSRRFDPPSTTLGRSGYRLS